MSQPTYLTSGSRIAMVGAVPAGSFFASELRAPQGEEPALMVSRSEFDQLLLERAEAAGAEVVRDRVTGLEFYPDNLEHPVRVYSEGASRSADMIVAACGLDDGLLSVLEQASPRAHLYRRPRETMHSIIIKLPCDERYIERRPPLEDERARPAPRPATHYVRSGIKLLV